MSIEFYRDGLWELPNSWVWARLGDLGRWSGGGTPSKSNDAFWTKGTIPWISPKDMKQDFVGDSPDRITKDAVANSTTKLIPKNSVLMVVRSGILNHTFPVAVSDREVTINQDMRAIIPHKGIDARFLALVLKRLQRHILYECSKDGTTVASVDADHLESILIPIAPTSEQYRIVARIDELFIEIADGEAALARAHAAILGRPANTGAQLRQSILKSAFEGRLVGQDPRDESADRMLLRVSEQTETIPPRVRHRSRATVDH